VGLRELRNKSDSFPGQMIKRHLKQAAVLLGSVMSLAGKVTTGLGESIGTLPHGL